MNDFYRCEKILIKLSNQLLSISARILLGDYKEVQGIKILTDFILCNITLKFELFRSIKNIHGCDTEYVETTKCVLILAQLMC